MTSNPIVTLFYRRLLALDENGDCGVLLEEALRSLVQVTSAGAAYVEIFDEHRDSHFSRAHGFTQEEPTGVRSLTSQGMIAHAIAEGRMLAISPTASVAASVAAKPGAAMVCVPVGTERPHGLVYLLGGSSGRSFSALDIEHVQLFARRIEPVALDLLPPRKLDEQVTAYKRRVIRKELRRNEWNMTGVGCN